MGEEWTLGGDGRWWQGNFFLCVCNILQPILHTNFMMKLTVLSRGDYSVGKAVNINLKTIVDMLSGARHGIGSIRRWLTVSKMCLEVENTASNKEDRRI